MVHLYACPVPRQGHPAAPALRAPPRPARQERDLRPGPPGPHAGLSARHEKVPVLSMHPPRACGAVGHFPALGIGGHRIPRAPTELSLPCSSGHGCMSHPPRACGAFPPWTMRKTPCSVFTARLRGGRFPCCYCRAKRCIPARLPGAVPSASGPWPELLFPCFFRCLSRKNSVPAFTAAAQKFSRAGPFSSRADAPTYRLCAQTVSVASAIRLMPRIVSWN